MDSSIVSSVLEKLGSEENLFWEYCNGNYSPPGVHWTWVSDGMGRTLLIGRVQVGEEPEDWDILYLFKLTDFDLEGLKTCIDEAVFQRV